MCLADKTLDVVERQKVATALANLLEDWGGEDFEAKEVDRPGPNFASGPAFWTNGMPCLSSFVTIDSFLLFRLIRQQPRNLVWLSRPVAEWQSYPAYTDFFEFFVTNKPVVNDAAER